MSLVSPGCRVIVDNDYQGDPDGLVALAHHLLSPANRVVAVTSSFLNPRFPGPSPPVRRTGGDLAGELLEVIGGSRRPPVHPGSEQPFGDRSGSSASAAIIDEARREDDLPLYVACGGPLTNVATALRDAPDIAARLTLIWIGGSLDGSHQLRGNAVSDAHLAVLAIEHGLEVCSDDSDFARFSEVRWTNPVAPPQPS